MKIQDLENGSTWVIGVPEFSDARFIKRKVVSGRNAGWLWTKDVTRAETFRTRESAEQQMRSTDLYDFLLGTRLVKAIKVELMVGVRMSPVAA